ncbi:MAG TPA: PLP-dependent aminotransferase family protein [Clostridiales bacterium]|nr:MAG: 2-aminoadipate transaminase [Firmicutes bacterium ADurb.Bin262]HOU10004.1 PLP-dependent aminotransferase family protein [Clostridiales bacterium]HQK72426.1 PLP-dependent aminotransferase family protein [Clostridiales bacterium]
MEYIFSDRISSLKPSAIREILKATSDPEVIAFSAGNPAPEAFPVDDIREITARILRERPVEALQYGVTEGYDPLRRRIAEYIKSRHAIGRDFDSVMVTSGAQQVVDLACKVFCNEGDTVVCEAPSFIGSLNCFRSYSVKLAGVPVEADGMDIDGLEAVLAREKRAKLIYTIPNFQNPSGATMSLPKRKRLYELAKARGVMILEDNPYGDLRVMGEHLPSIKSMDTEGIVIYAGSFSKILSPGLRVGFACAESSVISKMTVGKQTSDVHTPMLNQMLVDQWMETTDFEGHIKKIQAIYARKLTLMCDQLESRLGGFFSFHRPQGGLFVWGLLPEGVDMPGFCRLAVQKKVAIVPGSAFMVDENERTQAVRLNFSTPSDENIVKGVSLLAEAAAETRAAL